MSFVSSKGNILCRLIKIELYKIFAIINRAIKGLHCTCIMYREIIFLAQYFVLALITVYFPSMEGKTLRFLYGILCTEGHVSSHSCVVFFLHECVWSITDQRSLIENPENRRFICREGRWYEVPVPVLLFVATFSWLNTVRSWYIAIIVFEELTKKHRIARLRRRVCSFVRERNVWLKASPAYFFVLYALSN